MATCEVCGNDCDKSFEVTRDGESPRSTASSARSDALGPTCDHCGSADHRPRRRKPMGACLLAIAPSARASPDGDSGLAPRQARAASGESPSLEGALGDVGPVEPRMCSALGDQALASAGREHALDASASASGSRARKRRPAPFSGTTSRRPPVSATMQGQPEAIDSSATRPNGS